MIIPDLLVTNIDVTLSFRFFKVPQKVLIRKPWMVLLVNKPAGSAFADCSKIPKMVSINTFETFRVCYLFKGLNDHKDLKTDVDHNVSNSH